MREQFKVQFPRMGIETRFVNGDDPLDFEKLIDEKTKVCRTSNPALPCTHPRHVLAPLVLLLFLRSIFSVVPDA